MSDQNQYYANVNRALLEICPDVGRVIEFGCGAGLTMGVYRDRNPDCYSFGVEQVECQAAEAKKRFDQVVACDAESINLADYGCQEKSFDLLIYGDVLEHFVDPWSALAEHVKYLRTGGYLCACIPNTSHWSVILGLLDGRFEYEDSGLLDRTHLRFFTLASIKSLMGQAGLEIKDVKARAFKDPNTERALLRLGQVFGQDGSGITNVQRRDWSTFQYLVSAVKL